MKFLHNLTFFMLAVVQTGYADKVLFVGNSYTGQCSKTITELFKAESPNWELSFQTKGGKDLAFHLADTNCTERIRKVDWDYVVLQEQSQKSGLGGEYTKGFHQAVGALSKMIRETDATPCLYLTWGRQSGDKRNPKVYPDFEAMQQKITAAYLEAAEINDAIVLPTGWAYAETKKSSMERFNALYKKDGSHPSASGAYLVACVFWGSLTGKDPATIQWTGGINNKEAIHLRKAAKISLQN